MSGDPGAGPPGSGEAGPPHPRPRGPLITLDGPAGSGKSTTAREVARRLGYLHLDSGGLYRALTWALLREGVPPEGWPELVPEDLARRGVRLERTEAGLVPILDGRPLGPELRGSEVTEHVSRLARLPAVRDWLLDVQREVGREGGLVADGRDMGTVVFPDAEAKFFLVADLEERARRRMLERGEEPVPERIAAEASRIGERDRRDSERDHSPLRKPIDAVVLDTTRLSFDEQVERVLERVREVERGARP